MINRIFIVFSISFLIFGSFFHSPIVYSQTTPTPTPTTTTPSSGVIGFTQCNFSTTSESSSISPCVQQILTFLFVVGIFLMAFRIAYIGINRFNPLDGNSEGEQVGLIRDIIIGLILLGAPALILSAFNQNLLSLNFLNFTEFNGGPAKSTSTTSSTNLQTVIGPGGSTIVSTSNSTPVPAVATANISGGKVTSVSLTNTGSGYTTAPQVRITGGGGSGAVGVANVLGGKVTNIAITSQGSGYTSAPTVELVGGTSGGSVGSGSTNTTLDNNITDTVQGITAYYFQAAYEGYKLTGSDANDAMKKVIGAEAACQSVFAEPQYSPADCAVLKRNNLFISTLAQIPQGSKASFLSSSNFLGYSNYNYLTQDPSFTNLVDIQVSPTGAPSQSIQSYNFGVGGNQLCIENYIQIEAAGFPTRSISTQDCDNRLSDNSGITKFDTAQNTLSNNNFFFGRPIFVLNKSIIPNTITIPAGTQFNRKITYIN